MTTNKGYFYRKKSGVGDHEGELSGACLGYDTPVCLILKPCPTCISAYQCPMHLPWGTAPSFFFFRATLGAYGSFQARGSNQGCSCQPQTQQCGIWALSVTYITAHGNTRSLTHLARPGIELVSSWILVGFVTTEPWWELQIAPFFWPYWYK